MTDPRASSEARELARWQRRLLPFAIAAISLIALFFFATSLIYEDTLAHTADPQPLVRLRPGRFRGAGRLVSGLAIAPTLATARYFALFLQDRGQLAPVFRALRNRDPGGADDPAAEAVTLVEKITGPITALQVGYDQWLPTVIGRGATTRRPIRRRRLP